MKILVVGGGGREHTLAWKLANDSCKPEIFVAPGNAGTAMVGTNLDVGAEDVDGLLAWAVREQPDLTVVGPEVPLCAGIVDAFQAEDLRIFGPCQAAAQLEGSKSFSKEVMQAAGVPTAASETFTDVAKALEYVRGQGGSLVVKADGLAAGKGVFVCASVAEAEAAVRAILEENRFGESGAVCVVEECLSGEEASILALIDGTNIVMLASSQDHKRALDGDQGPNTGGMGAYSPAPVVREELWPVIEEQVYRRLIDELGRRNIQYKGVLYAGLMIDADGLRVLEYNCRFGDPETQVVIPRLAGDLLPALQACVDGGLEPGMLEWRRESCVCVVLASGGYPGAYEKGKRIGGLVEAGGLPDTLVFHAGTAGADADVRTAGGRVLGVTALGADLGQSVERAYEAVSRITFEGCQYRKDIAARALQR